MADGMNDHEMNMLRACMNDDKDMFAEAAQDCDINGGLNWFGRIFGISGLHYIERTPLMLATMYGSERVLSLILNNPGVDINRNSATDNLTAWDCFWAYKPPQPINENLLRQRDACYNQHADPGGFYYSFNKNVITADYDPDPDLSGWFYETQHFMTYKYKMRPCCFGELCPGWQFCPYLHPQDTIRRRNLREQWYTPVPCRYYPGLCPGGSNCGFAHGQYEWLFHPHWFRTLACPFNMLCSTNICCYAHNLLELRVCVQGLGLVYPHAPPPPQGPMGVYDVNYANILLNHNSKTIPPWSPQFAVPHYPRAPPPLGPLFGAGPSQVKYTYQYPCTAYQRPPNS